MSVNTKTAKDEKKLGAQIVKGSEVYMTHEFLFILDVHNRPIDDDKVRRFMKTFNEGKNFMKEFPAIIDPNTWVVLDGQHRYEACKRLGIPFYYRWALNGEFTIDNVVDVQHNSGWKSSDFMHSYIKQGNQNYVEVARFAKRYNVSISIAVLLLTSVNSKGELINSRGVSLKRAGFYDGNLVVKNINAACRIADRLEDIGKSGCCPFYRSDRFISAFISVLNHPHYDHATMMHKVNQFGASLMKPQTDTENYLRMLEMLYNYKAREENKLRFDRRYNFDPANN